MSQNPDTNVVLGLALWVAIFSPPLLFRVKRSRMDWRGEKLTGEGLSWKKNKPWVLDLKDEE